MELEEGELMEDAAASGPPGTEAKMDKLFCLLFPLYHILLYDSHCSIKVVVLKVLFIYCM